jgi:hypothetical protein
LWANQEIRINMTKNMTRKGLAFGATFALGASLLAGAPAQAIESNVSLAPTTGTEYTVLKGQSFSLSAQFSNAAKSAGTNLKFLVSDPAEKITGVTGQFTENVDVSGNSAAFLTVSSQDVTLEVAAASEYSTRDFVTVSTVTTGGLDGTINGTFQVTVVDTTNDTITYEVPSGTTPADAATGIVKVELATTGNRADNKSFVIDTKTDVNAANIVATLTAGTADATTQTATVTAWIDTNDDGQIDAVTEYASPPRLVRFINPADLAVATSISPVSSGDADLQSFLTTEPVLNGEQVGVANVGAVFTRQDSSAQVAAKSTTWNDTTKRWTTTASLSTSLVISEASSSNKLYGTGTAAAWTGLTRPAGQGITNSTTKVVSDVLTVTTAGVHSLRVGDKVTITGATSPTTDVNAEHTITSIPSTTTFTAALDTADIAATTGTVVYTVTTYGSNNGIVDRGFAGTYTATAAFLPFGNIAGTSQFLLKAGTAATTAASSKTAAAVAVDAVESANVGRTGASAGTADVRIGTNEATVLVTVTNSDGKSVGAGVPVSASVAETVVGTPSVNGSTNVVVFANTDANGQAMFVVNNPSGVLNETVTLTIAAQGVAGGNTQVLTWNDRVYSIVDLNDPSAVASAARTRAVAEGASYTFDLLLQDQFRVAAGAEFRLKATVTGNTVETKAVSLTAGRASLVVADGGLTTGDTTVSVTIEKLTGTTWAAPADASINTWDTAGANDLAVVLIKYYSQTDVLTLNADAATLPSTTAADFSAAVTTKAFAGADTRVTTTAAPEVVVAGKAVVSGAVTSSSTGAAKSGEMVTLTGAGLLFKSGGVWSVGSATQIAIDGTFAVDVYSLASGTKVVTVAVGSLTKTASLVYSGIIGDPVLTVITPAAVKPASTFQVKAMLADSSGNPVDTAVGKIRVTYTGAGIVFGNLPTETDANGELQFSVLLGSNDTGTVSVTVQYNHNDDTDFTDAKDLTSSSTTVITASGELASDTIVNVGTFSGKLVVYALNAAGSEVSYRIAGKWVTQVVTSDSLMRYDRVVGATGKTIKVDIYVDGVLKLAKSVVTK